MRRTTGILIVLFGFLCACSSSKEITSTQSPTSDTPSEDVSDVSVEDTEDSSSDLIGEPDAKRTYDTGKEVVNCATVQDGEACDDGDACTLNDQCENGVCTGGESVVCDEEGACRVGACTADGGCSYVDADEGASCSTPCFTESTCQSGQCVTTLETAVLCPTSDNSCVSALTCDTVSGDCTIEEHYPEGTVCDSDDDLCSLELCNGEGQCATDPSTAVVCEPSTNACASNACDSATGICAETSLPNGTVCEDGKACTEKDTCQDGTCVSGVDACCAGDDECSDDDPCTEDSCDPATNQCSFTICEGICTECAGPNHACTNGQCVCTPLCAPGTCGDDGCGQSCGCVNQECVTNKKCYGPFDELPVSDAHRFAMNEAQIYYAVKETIHTASKELVVKGSWDSGSIALYDLHADDLHLYVSGQSAEGPVGIYRVTLTNGEPAGTNALFSAHEATELYGDISHLYWKHDDLDGNKSIYRQAKSAPGSNPISLATDSNLMHIEPHVEFVYFTSNPWNAVPPRVSRVSKDGGAVTVLHSAQVAHVHYSELAVSSTHVYWFAIGKQNSTWGKNQGRLYQLELDGAQSGSGAQPVVLDQSAVCTNSDQDPWPGTMIADSSGVFWASTVQAQLLHVDVAQGALHNLTSGAGMFAYSLALKQDENAFYWLSQQTKDANSPSRIYRLGK